MSCRRIKGVSLLARVFAWHLLGVLLLASSAGAAPTWVGRVEYVVDGDTVHVMPMTGGPLQKIRLLDLDAPELCQAWGPQARQALMDRLLGQSVTVKGGDRDDYRRLLATIWLDGQDMGAWLVAQGHAWSYRWHDHAGPYDHLEREARQQSLGLFSQAGSEAPFLFRRRHGSCYPK